MKSQGKFPDFSSVPKLHLNDKTKAITTYIINCMILKITTFSIYNSLSIKKLFLYYYQISNFSHNYTRK